MQDRVWNWTFRLPAPPEKVWSLVADTDRFNRSIGLPPVEFKFQDKPGAPRRTGRFQILGMDVSWDEFPFVFVEPKLISVLRRYHKGPLLELESTITLVPSTDGTELTHSIRARPRNAAGAAVALLQIGILTGRSIKKSYSSMAHALGAGVPFYKAQPALGESFRNALSRDLDGIEHGTFLLDHLVSAPPDDLLYMRPFRLARAWKIPRNQALRVFLQATKRGVVDAAWTIICPHCRGVQSGSSTLSQLEFEAAHCATCAVDFEADFDRLTELTFHLSPRLKELSVDTFCVGGPGKTPHVFAQSCVPAEGELVLPISLPHGAYRIRAWQTKRPAFVNVVDDGETRAAFTITPERAAPNDIQLAPSSTLTIRNPSDREAAVVIERTAWADDACPASYVAAFQEFRDLFSSDVLAPGVAVKIANVSILFTDLKGSTALYQRAGDAPAFGLVRNHFDRLTEVVREHEGAVVKTIGDAVMAVFTDPVNAVRAAKAMHTAVSDLASPDGEPVLLKIGLHSGPCFAVTLSERLDYFGTTVNLAARIQGQAEGGDTVLDHALAQLPEIKPLLQELPIETFEAELKGIDGVRRLIRLRIAEPSAV